MEEYQVDVKQKIVSIARELNMLQDELHKFSSNQEFIKDSTLLIEAKITTILKAL